MSFKAILQIEGEWKRTIEQIVFDMKGQINPSTVIQWDVNIFTDSESEGKNQQRMLELNYIVDQKNSKVTTEYSIQQQQNIHPFPPSMALLQNWPYFSLYS